MEIIKKFIVSVRGTKSPVLVKRKKNWLQKGLNIGLPQRAWFEKTVYWEKTQWLSGKKSFLVQSVKDPSLFIYLINGIPLNSDSYCQLLRENLAYLLNDPRTHTCIHTHTHTHTYLMKSLIGFDVWGPSNFRQFLCPSLVWCINPASYFHASSWWVIRWSCKKARSNFRLFLWDAGDTFCQSFWSLCSIWLSKLCELLQFTQIYQLVRSELYDCF